MSIDSIKYAKNRAYQFVEEQQRALDAGQITEAQWFDNHNRYITAHYLAGDNPRAQSGQGGDEAAYRYKRMMILEAIHKSGAFLDVGCANGYLMESLERWLQGTGLHIDFYGVDISEGLVALAKQRLPQWQERLFHANALYWVPPRKFDFVYLIGLELVPLGRQQEFVAHLLDQYVAGGGRLILGPISEERAHSETEDMLNSWGYKPSGYCEKSHHTHEVLARKMFWLDKA